MRIAAKLLLLFKKIYNSNAVYVAKYKAGNQTIQYVSKSGQIYTAKN